MAENAASAPRPARPAERGALRRRILSALVLIPVALGAIWIGAIPSFVLVLRHLQDAESLRLVGTRFSRMSMIGVASILLSGAIMCVFYIGDLQGFYGTAYGIMVGAKIAMFLGLLALGFGNFMVTERLRKGQTAQVIRMRRFAEVEIGIGFERRS